MQSPAWRDVLAGEAIEAFPVEPGTLAPPQAEHAAKRGTLLPGSHPVASGSSELRGTRSTRSEPVAAMRPRCGTGSCRRRYKMPRIAVRVARIRFFTVTR